MLRDKILSSQKSVMTSISSPFSNKQALRAKITTMGDRLPKPDDPTQSCHESLCPSGWTTAPACESLLQVGPAEPSLPHGSQCSPQLWSALQASLQPVLLLGVQEIRWTDGLASVGEASSGSTAPSTQMALWPPSFELLSLLWGAPAACRKGLLGGGHGGCQTSQPLMLAWASVVGAGALALAPGGAIPWCGSEWQQVALPGLMGHMGVWLLL